MKFSYTKNTESDFFLIKKSNLTKKKFWQLGWEGWGVARVSIFFSFFKRIQVWKKKQFSF